MTKHRLARTLKREFDTKEDHYDRVAAQLGNETGTVEITGRVNYHYARIVGQGKAFPVFNVRTAPIPDLWVWVGFDPDDPTTPWQVLGKIGGKLDYGDNNAGSTLPLHAETHRFLGLGARGGLDTLWVELRQFMPFRVGPSSGLNIVVYRGVAWTGTQFIEVPAETIDLTSLVPSTSNQAIFVLVTIDNTGDIITTAGSEVDFDALTELDIPAIPSDTKYVLAAVRLYEGQDAIQEGRTNTDIFDLRFAWASGEVTVGDGGSGGMINPMIATGDMITYDVQGGTGENAAIYNNGATADASSEYAISANTFAYAVYALEGFSNSAWQSGAGDAIPSCWWKCILPQEAVIKEIQVWQNDVSNYTASQFKLQVSDDDISYSDVDTFTPTDVTIQETYTLTTPTRGKYWKLVPLTASNPTPPYNTWHLKFVGLYPAGDENVIRLPIGSEGEVLTVVSGLPNWEPTTAIGGGIFPDDPYTDAVSNDGYTTVRTNPASYRWNAITSVTLTGTTYQAISFWDSDGYLVLGKRTIDGDWTLYTYDGSGGLPTIQVTGSDNHDVANIGIDPNGFIHIAYDMHAEALNYAKSDAAINTWTGGLSTGLSMVGTNETSVTYPTFLNDPAGNLYFMFRDTASSNGDWYFYKYTHGTTTWAATTGSGAGGKILDGSTPNNYPYINHPAFDSDFGSGGFMHLSWHWRGDAADGDSNYDVGYARWDGTNWTQSGGGAQTIPITTANDEVIDPVVSGSGLTSFNSVGSDSSGNPHVVYAKDGADGFRHIYHAYHNGTSWTIKQLTVTKAPGGDDASGTIYLVPSIAIDRATDTVYVFYVDHNDSEGLSAMKSAAANYDTWDRIIIYPRGTGRWHPKYDYVEWDRSTVAYFLIEYWEAGQSSLPIRVLKWTPGTDQEYSHTTNPERLIDFVEHATAPGTPASGYGRLYVKSDGLIYFKDDAGTEYDLTETGSGGGSSAVFAPVTDGDIATPEIIFNNGEVVVNYVPA